METQWDLWSYLKSQTKPIVLWGMGNGADKILHICDEKKIVISDFFASDGFVRGHAFRGKTVLSYYDVCQKYGMGQFIILLAFGSSLSDVIRNIETVANENELYAPDVPCVGDNLFDNNYWTEHKKDLEATRDLFYDQKSKDLFDNILLYKYTGKINYLLQNRDNPADIWKTILHPDLYKNIIDLGAYTGDTIREILPMAPHLKTIEAWEPDERTYKKLVLFSQSISTPLINPYHLAAWNQHEILSFGSTGGRGAALSNTVNIKTVDADSVDNRWQGQKIDYIKYDVEGAEYQALIGSKKVIQSCQPELLVSLYHRTEDLYKLPLLVHEINPSYRLYLRRPGGLPAWDINLYAVSSS